MVECDLDDEDDLEPSTKKININGSNGKSVDYVTLEDEDLKLKTVTFF